MGGRDDEGLYDFAGKGAKRRRQHGEVGLRRSTFKPIDPARKKSQLSKQPTKGTAGPNDNPNDIKEIIRRLVIDHVDIKPAEIRDALQREGYFVSLTTIANLRRDMREVLRLLQKPDLALVDPDDLSRRRRKRDRLYIRTTTSKSNIE
ncbi:hypothetical protein GA0061098_1015108 [Bradyrhizobium shewense]|uniref:Uncharacterized protein n=1 Tax=Bradyrhizobium shewense TaxID=1761772 RepID=A0A1C3XG80_9BRAD|nr:hypothetical protein [Bradyrhizobium shewense]SCB51219.1 hypothetical protein GA0061098_1015108 [Bradyrhizobium shewense]